jgi:hypothetical protein
MDDGTFMYDEGLNAPPQPHPHQPQLEESFSYNTTVDSNALQYQDANQGDQRWSLEVPVENQPLPPPPPGNSVDYGTAQYDQSPAWSNTATTVNGDSNRATNLTNHAVASSTGSRGNNQTLEDHIGVFSIRSNLEENRRRRRAFDPETRRKVAMLRKVGSCSRCKARRIRVSVPTRLHGAVASDDIKCNFPGPCLSCRKAAESISLAKHICIRQTLIDLRFGDTSFGRHLLYILNLKSDFFRFSLPVLHRGASQDRDWRFSRREEDYCLQSPFPRCRYHNAEALVSASPGLFGLFGTRCQRATT